MVSIDGFVYVTTRNPNPSMDQYHTWMTGNETNIVSCHVEIYVPTLKSTCASLGVDSCCERTVRDSFASSLRRENTGGDGEGVVQGEVNLL